MPLESNTSTSCKEFIRHFGFIYSFYDKYGRIWTSLNFKLVGDSVEHRDLNEEQTLERLKKMGWMIFITARLILLYNKIEILDCVWMLMATIYILLVNLNQSEVTCSIMEECAKEKLTETQIKDKVLEKLCRFFKVNEIEPVSISIDLLLSLLIKFKKKGIIVVKNEARLNADVEMGDDEEDKDMLDVKQKVRAQEGSSDEIKGMF